MASLSGKWRPIIVATIVAIGGLFILRAQGRYLETCPTRPIDEHGWRPVPVVYAPLTLRLPPTATVNQKAIGSVDVGDSLGAWSMIIDVAPVPAAPHLLEDIPVPLFISEFGARMCTETLDGRAVPIKMYESHSQLNGPYMADAAWPLAKGSWLVIGTASSTEGGRAVMLAAFRSLHVDTSPAILAAMHPSKMCPAWPALPVPWKTRTLAVGPVVFTTPPRLQQLQGSIYTAVWQLPDGTGLAFNILHTPGWQLSTYAPQNQGLWQWCRMDIDGHRTEVRVDTQATGGDAMLRNTYMIDAFMRISADRVLAISAGSGLVNRGIGKVSSTPNSLGEIFQILQSAHIR